MTSGSIATPELQLETLFTLDAARRITGTREPGGTRGPLFTLIRSNTAVAFAVRDESTLERWFRYSTSWTNSASLAVARKLGLIAYASDWSLLGA